MLGAFGGGNTITSGAGDLVVVASTGANLDTINANGDAFGGTTLTNQITGIVLNPDAAANLIGSGNTVTLAADGVLGAYGGGNTITTGTGDLLVIGSTGANLDTINANGDAFGGTTLTGQETGIIFKPDAAANLIGSGNTVTLNPDDVLGAYGGGNTITSGAGDLVVVGSTGANLDTINANGDAFGGTTLTGQETGIIFHPDAAANLFGSSNTVTLGVDDVLGAYGGGNTITSGAGDLVVVGSTGANLDTINANGDAFGGTTLTGQETGIIFHPDAAANLFGSSNTVTLGADDVLGAYGGGNTITSGAGDLLVVGNTGPTFDTLYANGDAFGGTTLTGQETGIIFHPDAAANLGGSGNTVTLNSDDVLGAYGGGNVINAGAGDLVVIASTGGNRDTINASGDAVGGTTLTNQVTGIYLADGSQATINGSYNTISVAPTASLNADVNSNDISWHHADGSMDYTSFDKSGNQAWYVYGEQIDAQGREVSATYFNREGSRDVDYYDAYGTQSYSSFGMHFDAYGTKLTQTYFNDDGSRDYTTFDANNNLAWSSYTEHFNAQNVETSRSILDDNGSRAVETWRNGGIYSPDRPSEIDYYSAAGSLDMEKQIIYTHVSGSDVYNLARVDDYNETNQGGWSDVTNLFNNSGYMTNQYTTDSNNQFVSLPSMYSNYTSNFAYTGYGDELSLFSSNPTDYYDVGTFNSGGYDGAPFFLDDYGYGDDEVGFAPVVLDLDGNGVDLTLHGSSTAQFVVDGSGVQRHVTWAGKNDGLLVIDLSADGSAGGDGLITQPKEVSFADWTASDPHLQVSDLAALRQVFDSNGDGVLDKNDARFGEFKIWVDANQNGVSDPGELKSLSDLGVTSINLSEVGGTQRLSDGTLIQGVTHYATADGSTHLAADVTFATSVDVQAGVPVNTVDPTQHVTINDGGTGYTVTDASGASVPLISGQSTAPSSSLSSANTLQDWVAAEQDAFAPPSRPRAAASRFEASSTLDFAPDGASAFADPSGQPAWMSQTLTELSSPFAVADLTPNATQHADTTAKAA